MSSQGSYLAKLSCSKETVAWFSPVWTLICFYKKMTEKTNLYTRSNCKAYTNGTQECLCNELDILEDLVLWVQLYSFSNVGTVKCFCKSPQLRKRFRAFLATKWHLNESMGYQIFRSWKRPSTKRSPFKCFWKVFLNNKWFFTLRATVGVSRQCDLLYASSRQLVERTSSYPGTLYTASIGEVFHHCEL